MILLSNSNQSQNHGFTLLEMLVALLIMTMVGSALYDIVNQQFVQFRHIQNSQADFVNKQWLTQWSNGFSQQHKPQGEETINPYHIRWQSVLITSPPSIDPLSLYAESGYWVGLYSVNAHLYKDEKLLTSAHFIQVGSRPLVYGKPYSLDSSQGRRDE